MLKRYRVIIVLAILVTTLFASRYVIFGSQPHAEPLHQYELSMLVPVWCEMELKDEMVKIGGNLYPIDLVDAWDNTSNYLAVWGGYNSSINERRQIASRLKRLCMPSRSTISGDGKFEILVQELQGLHSYDDEMTVVIKFKKNEIEILAPPTNKPNARLQ